MIRGRLYNGKIIFYLDGEIKKKLKAQVKKEGRTLSEVLRMLIADYLKKENSL